MTDTVVNSEVYQQNIEFWGRAWSGVKAPYTQMPDLEYLPRIPQVFESKKDKRILDLGCGSGWLSIFLARNDFDVTGVDLAEHAIELGNMWAAQESLSIDFQTQDITDLKFPKDYFGGVIANSIFEHLTHTLAEQTVARIEGFLEEGGIFFGCFDKVGTGPGEYYKLEDGTQVYTDKGRKGMMLRCFSDEELQSLFKNWKIQELSTLENGSRILIATI